MSFRSVPPYLLELPYALPIARTADEFLVRPLRLEFYANLGETVSRAVSPVGAKFALLGPSKSKPKWMELIQIMDPAIDLTTAPPLILFLDDPLPNPWTLWVLSEMYGISPFIEGTGSAPVILPTGTWKRLEQHEQDVGLKELTAAVLQRDSRGHYRSKDKTALRRAIRKLPLLEETPPVITRIAAGSFPLALALVGSWEIELPNEPRRSIDLNVFLRRNPDDSVSVAFDIEENLPAGKGVALLGTGSGVTAAMKASGLWIEESEKQAWLDQHIVQPTWLIDPTSLIDPYRLLGLPSPLVLPQAQLIGWLED